jgi:hypothetical protein
MEVNGSGKHSSLLQYGINYFRKKFNSTGPLHLICHRHKQGSLTEGGRSNTIDLLVLVSLDQLLFILKGFFPLNKTSYLNQEVNRTKPSPSVRVPWPKLSIDRQLKFLTLIKKKLTTQTPCNTTVIVIVIEMKGITRCKLTIISESAVCKKFLGQIVSYLVSL